jgi:hypothetical protein
MRRTMTTANPTAVMPRLAGTVNRDPIWGEPAESLFLAGFQLERQSDGSWQLDMDVTGRVYRLDGAILHEVADWSEIEPSLPLAD